LGCGCRRRRGSSCLRRGRRRHGRVGQECYRERYGYGSDCCCLGDSCRHFSSGLSSFSRHISDFQYSSRIDIESLKDVTKVWRLEVRTASSQAKMQLQESPWAISRVFQTSSMWWCTEDNEDKTSQSWLIRPRSTDWCPRTRLRPDQHRHGALVRIDRNPCALKSKAELVMVVAEFRKAG
jgi:hypothetical protein